MNTLEYVGLGLVGLAAGLMLLFYGLSRRSQKRTVLRYIPAFQRLRRAAGLAVEEGKRLYISLGNSSLLSSTNASALVGLAALERLARLSMVSDRPTIASSGNAALTVLSQDVLLNSYRSENLLESYQAKYGQLAGVTPFSYAAGSMPLISDEQASVNLFSGNFGAEVILMNEAAEQQNAYVLACSDSLTAQAVFYAASQEPLIGEELFAIPAYIQSGTMHTASLRTQDVLRWLVIISMLAGTTYSILVYFGYL